MPAGHQEWSSQAIKPLNLSMLGQEMNLQEGLLIVI